MSDFFNSAGAVLNGVGNLSSNILSNYLSWKNSERNIDFTREINDLNYQRQLAENNLTREREDNAIQRRVADLQAAGLSSTLAAGSPASASALSPAVAEAPQSIYEYSNLMANVDVTRQIAELKSIAANTAAVSGQEDRATELHAYQLSLKDLELKLGEENLRIGKATLNKLYNENRKIDSEIAINELRKAGLSYENSILCYQYITEERTYLSKIDRMNAENDSLAHIYGDELNYDELTAQIQKLYKDMEIGDSQIALNYNKADTNSSNAVANWTKIVLYTLLPLIMK